MDDNQFGWLRTFWAAAPRINRAGAIVIALTLLVVLNPEVRIALLVIDAVGFDVFVLFLLFQARSAADYVYRHWIQRLGRMMLDWGPVPFRAPTREAFRQSLALSLCSLCSPLVAFGVISSSLLLTCLCVGAAARLWNWN